MADEPIAPPTNAGRLACIQGARVAATRVIGTLTGLDNETLVGRLYGLGSNGGVYAIDATTAALHPPSPPTNHGHRAVQSDARSMAGQPTPQPTARRVDLTTNSASLDGNSRQQPGSPFVETPAHGRAFESRLATGADGLPTPADG